jgi:hypothetical protein
MTGNSWFDKGGVKEGERRDEREEDNRFLSL